MAYEVSLVVVQALIMLAEVAGRKPTFNLNDIKSHISHQDLERLKDKIDDINTPEAKQLSLDMQKILSTPADYYSKVASSLRVADPNTAEQSPIIWVKNDGFHPLSPWGQCLHP